MRMMLKMTLPASTTNVAIKDGSFGKMLSSMLGRLKPEATYFTTMDGNRGGFIIFDLQDPTDIPVICEPLFLELQAKVEIVPVMTAEEVEAGLVKAAAG